MEPLPQPRILVKRSAALGDVLLASAVLEPLKNRFPGHLIDFCTRCPSILAHHPFVAGIVSDPFDRSRYERIYDLDLAYERRPDSSILHSFAHVAGVGFGELRLLLAVPEKNRILADRLLDENGVSFSRPLIAMQTAGSFWVKNWPLNYYEHLAETLRRDLGADIAVLGIPADPLIGGAVDCRGIPDIMTSIAILARCTAFVGIDSLFLHCAKALGVPIAAFFGHSDPALRIAAGPNDCIFSSDLECRFCHHRQSPPAFITVCRRQHPALRFLDGLFQRAIRFRCTHERLTRFHLDRAFFSLLKWRERGRVVAPCMKHIAQGPASARISAWVGSLLSSSAERRSAARGAVHE
jgi:ADP-heptose:LPS heptosyltransferase